MPSSFLVDTCPFLKGIPIPKPSLLSPVSLPYRHGSVFLLNTLHPRLPVLPGGLSLEWCLWFCAMSLGTSSTYSAHFLPDATRTQTHSYHLLLVLSSCLFLECLHPYPCPNAELFVQGLIRMGTYHQNHLLHSSIPRHLCRVTGPVPVPPI